MTIKPDLTKHRSSPCARFLALLLALALGLPNPAFALRPAGLEESNEKTKRDLVAALTDSPAPFAGLEEKLQGPGPGTGVSFWSRSKPAVALSALIGSLLGLALLTPQPPQPPQNPPGPVLSPDVLQELVGSTMKGSALQRSLEHEIYSLRKGSPPYNYLYLKSDELRRLEPMLPRYPIQMPRHVEPAQSIQELLNVKLEKTQPFVVKQLWGEPIFYIVFENSRIQGLAFDLPYLFVEARPSFLGDKQEFDIVSQEVELTGGGGMDFQMSDIARFFSEAGAQGIALNAVQERIKEELIQAGLLAPGESGYVAMTEAALLSTPQHASRADVAHEINHGIYFTDRGYRQAAQELWDSLSEPEQALARDILAVFHYSEEDQDLLTREFIAFFRDPEELLQKYLVPYGDSVLESKEGDLLHRLRPYYGEEGRLKSTVLKTIGDLTRRVHSIDQKSAAYRQGAAGLEEDGLSLLSGPLTPDRRLETLEKLRDYFRQNWKPSQIPPELYRALFSRGEAVPGIVSVFDGLTELLQDPDPKIRRAAHEVLSALGRFLDRASVPQPHWKAAFAATSENLSDPDPEVRIAAFETLAQVLMGRASRDQIRTILPSVKVNLEHPSSTLCVAVLRVVSEILFVDTLARAPTREDLADVIGEVQKRVNDPDEEVHQVALEVMGHVELMAPYLPTPEEIAALQRMDPREALIEEVRERSSGPPGQGILYASMEDGEMRYALLIPLGGRAVRKGELSGIFYVHVIGQPTTSLFLLRDGTIKKHITARFNEPPFRIVSLTLRELVSDWEEDLLISSSDLEIDQEDLPEALLQMKGHLFPGDAAGLEEAGVRQERITSPHADIPSQTTVFAQRDVLSGRVIDALEAAGVPVRQFDLENVPAAEAGRENVYLLDVPVGSEREWVLDPDAIAINFRSAHAGNRPDSPEELGALINVAREADGRVLRVGQIHRSDLHNDIIAIDTQL